MKILVVGATGKTGQKLLQQLQETEHSVTGLIRDTAQTEQITQFDADTLIGDLSQNVTNVPKGFDAIIFVAGSGGKDVQGVDYQGLANLVDAAVAADVKRFLYIGSINNGKPADQFIQEMTDFYQSRDEEVPEGLLTTANNPGYQTYVEMKAKAENHIVNSGINYTVLRAGLLLQDEGSGKVAVTEGTLNAFGFTARDNIAQCFIQALENANAYHKIYTVLDGETDINDGFK
tara:strand:- start:141314 stop:142009 length:696 start_codon:yes stop_codon:yes gene_type:complete